MEQRRDEGRAKSSVSFQLTEYDWLCRFLMGLDLAEPINSQPFVTGIAIDLDHNKAKSAGTT